MKKLLTLCCVVAAIGMLNAQDPKPVQTDTTKEETANDDPEVSSDKVVISKDSLLAVMMALINNKEVKTIETGTFKANIGGSVPIFCYYCTPLTAEQKATRKAQGKREINSTSSYSESNEKAKIEVVDISIIDGTIREITIYTDQGKFTNKRSPISIPYFEYRLHDKLGHFLNSGALQQKRTGERQYSCKEKYIVLGQVLHYDSKIGKNYVPDDTNLTLNAAAPTKTLSLNPDLNVLVNARLYTDVLGILDEQPNGLTQTDLLTRIILNTRNVPNSGFTFLNYIKIGGTLSKFDKKYKAVAANDELEIGRQALMQRSWANVGMDVNFFRTWLSKKSANYFGIDVGAAGYWAKATKGADSDTANVFLPTYSIKSFFELKPFDNFGFDCSLSLMGQRITNNDWITNYHASTFVRFECILYYNTFGNQNSRVYLRFANIYNRDQTRQTFQQLQFGYTITLNQAFKSKDD